MKMKTVVRLLGLLAILTLLVSNQSQAFAAAPVQGTGTTASIHIDTSKLRTVAPTSIHIGDVISYAVDLQNLPSGGLTSADFACRYDETLVDVSSTMTDSGRFGTSPVIAINPPAAGTFVYAIAGTSGQKATTAGTVFTFDVTASAAGSFVFECNVRASTGSSLFSVAFTPTTITVVDPTGNGNVTGIVTANKPITVALSGTALTATPASGVAFNISAPAGTYTITASAAGFLSATGSVTVTSGATTTKTTIALKGGDVDGNGTINALDVSTIGINYNRSTPAEADLNADGIINILDLQMLAANYGATTSTW